jgi:hypothetical protein
MSRLDGPYCSIEELHETQLNDFESMFRSGVAVAIPAALHYCAEYGLGAPAWLVKASVDLLCITLQRNSPKKRGRAAGLVARYCQDMIDFGRWDEVRVIRDQQKNYRKQVKELRALPKAKGEFLQKQKKLIGEQEQMLSRLGRTFDDAFECASKSLKETKARGGWDTIRRSYREVERNLKDPAQAMRYHVFSPQFLRKLEIKAPLDMRQG